MREQDFDFYSATSIPFGIAGAVAIILGIYSPWLLGFCARKFKVNYSALLLGVVVSSIGATAVVWAAVEGIGFTGLLIRELLTLYTVGLACGSIWLRSKANL